MIDFTDTSLLFSLDFHPVAYVLAGIAVLASIWICLFLLPRLKRVRRRIESDTASPIQADEECLPVSVIVTTRDDGELLIDLLKQILTQDYPAPMEVIVVDMDDDKVTQTRVSQLQKNYTNLYITYAPRTSRNLSRRKLALTLGVKAAANDALVFTSGNCRLASDQWLRRMVAPMAAGKSVVVGYSRLEQIDCDGRLRACRRRAFDSIRTAVRMFNAALVGKFLRADRNNLVFSRKLFYDHKGYSEHFDLIDGDDDVFIRRIATRENCEVVLAQQSFVTQLCHNEPSVHRLDVMHRNFCAHYLRRGPRFGWKVTSVMWWMWLGTSVASIATSVPSLIPLCALTIWNVAFSLIVGRAWRCTSEAFGSRRLLLTVPWLALGEPVYTFGCHLHADGASTAKFIWQQEMQGV